MLANALLGDAEIEIKWNGQVGKVEGPVRLILQELTIAPGGHTGWHTHGGPLFVSLVQGSLTLFHGDDPCHAEGTYTANSAAGAFFDPGSPHVHIARNLGSTMAIVRVQYMLPVGAAVRIDEPAPAGAASCP